MYPVWPSTVYPTAPQAVLGTRRGLMATNIGPLTPYYAVSPQVIASGGAEFSGWLPNIPEGASTSTGYMGWGVPNAYPSLASVQPDRWQPSEPTEALEPEPEPLPDKHWTPPQYREKQDPTLLKQDIKVALQEAKKAGEEALPEESKQPEAKVEARDHLFEWKEAGRHFKEGFISPAVSMWQNKKKTLAGVALGGSLLFLTRGLILPVFTTLGFGVTLVQLAGGAYKVAKEKDPDLKERAFYNFGAAASTLLLNTISGFSGPLKRVVATQEELLEAGQLSTKVLDMTAKEVEGLNGLKSAWQTVKITLPSFSASLKRILNPSHWGTDLWDKAKGVTRLHLTIADAVKSTFSQGGIIGSLMMVMRHLANGYEVFSDAHLDLTNLPDLTPQQREYLRKMMAQRAQQLGQLPGVNNLSIINWSNLPIPNMPNWNRFNPMHYWPNVS